MNPYNGSKKCILDLVESENFIDKINDLIRSSDSFIDKEDIWFPKGLKDTTEKELKDFLISNSNPNLANNIYKWWISVGSNCRTPVWDLISTCTIKNKRGILLVEGKAHCDEINNECKGKELKFDASDNSKANHVKIYSAIDEAKISISNIYPEIKISRDNCYQLSNRIAHAWWLANNGIPVVLMYLGFLNCNDRDYNGNLLFKNDNEWQNCFYKHAERVGVDSIIKKWIQTGKSEFILICKSFE